ncbi:MAG: hypothetical protein AAGA34_10425 [Pseudomonadota bacterium]
MKAILTHAIALGEKYERPIALAGGVWLFISCASWIPFIPIPKIPYLTDSQSWVFAGAWNAVWWGLVYPLIDQRRKEMAAEADTTAQTRPEPPTKRP